MKSTRLSLVVALSAALFGWIAVGPAPASGAPLLQFPWRTGVIHGINNSYDCLLHTGATRHVDMHILIGPDKSFEEAHLIGDHIEHEIQERYPGAIVVLHLEPDEGQERETIESLAAGELPREEKV